MPHAHPVWMWRLDRAVLGSAAYQLNQGLGERHMGHIGGPSGSSIGGSAM
jgi:hypothetical protein